MGIRLHMQRTLLAVATGAVLLGGLAASAGAATFNYSQQGGFTIGTETATNIEGAIFGPANSGLRFFGPQPDDPLLAGTQYSTMGWGGSTGATFVTNVNPIGEANTSALRVETLAGQVTDNGVPVNVALVTHQNNDIFPNFLNTVTIDTALRFLDGATPVDIGAGAVASLPIRLVETNNHVACDPDIQLGAIPCTDYFVFPLEGFFTPLTFSYQGVDYTVNFNLVPLAGAVFETVDCANPGDAPVDPNTFPGELCGRIRTVEGSTNQILITMALTSETPPTNACPRTQGYWKNHREAIIDALDGIDFLVVGGQNYTVDELIEIFTTPPRRGNATLILAHQLIATKLNLLSGSDPAPIQATVLAADALLAGLNPPLKFVRTSTVLGQQMVELANTLDEYNNGANTPNCTGPE